ncbi:ATP-binding protein [Azospirillum sp. SYSU D00513]|uniref:ATP-binding protein n=1 Tax=Azospirillum sp. SYSU D00513 TaxID=2812561 RepID=UPI001A975E36|nr:ATP-binding protein [Azospirillum sp. SYSU D00513]
MISSLSCSEDPDAGRPFCVARERLPADLALRAASRFGLSAGGNADRAEATLLPAGSDRERWLAALEHGAFFAVELTEQGDAQGDWAGVPPVTQGFYLSLTTATAYGLQCAVLVCDALARRGVLTDERRPAVELCLHEAIANAILHGNMGIPSAPKEKPEGHRLFSQLIQDRLGDGAVRGRRLDLFVRWEDGTLSIAVLDQGGGFDSSALPETARRGARSGRGFLFMRSLARAVTVTDGGRCTLLQFDL